MKQSLLSALLFLVTTTGAIAAFPTVVTAQQEFKGLAAWYGPGFAGNKTASGEVFNPDALTAAHRSLPFGTQVRVTEINGIQAPPF